MNTLVQQWSGPWLDMRLQMPQADAKSDAQSDQLPPHLSLLGLFYLDSESKNSNVGDSDAQANTWAPPTQTAHDGTQANRSSTASNTPSSSEKSDASAFGNRAFVIHAPFVTVNDEQDGSDDDATVIDWSDDDATIVDGADTDTDTTECCGDDEFVQIDPKYATLDHFIDQYEGDDLSKWNDMASAGQCIALERPIAAVQILSGKVDGATDEMKQAALQYVNDNPSLQSALQRTGALKSDGTVDQGKMGDFLNSVHKNLEQADNNIQEYMKKHPDADPDSLATARSAALLQAYIAITGESTGHQDAGGKNHSYNGGKGGGMVATKEQVFNLTKNDGFADAVKNSAKALSTNGGFDALDRAGVDKATNKADNLINDDNLTSFIKDEAPTDEQSDLSFLKDAGLKNITANTDISTLNQDIFAHPGNYTAEQKAAVMCKLMQTLINVQAGGSDHLRNVDETVKVLSQDIQTLAKDPAVGEYLKKNLPPEMESLAQLFEKAGGGAASSGGAEGTDSSGNGSSSANPTDIIDTIKDAVKGTKDVGSWVARGAGAAGEAAAETGEVATKIATTAARVAGNVAGEAVAGIVGAVSTVLDALGPIGEIAGVIATIVSAIVEAVHKKQNQEKFADNVNPTLQQFGIPLPT
ncbi:MULTISPECIES: type III effector HrpK domain-containing protein [Mycetohabitans]|uniref:type III effector HrpK domain-containing protein n=1 Tax=Mycetohabitans TaxID=2571159 RepID=UPI001F37DA97|nr:type III effector HrpK domain-containing protein [Mycetohabitans sp. B2]